MTRCEFEHEEQSTCISDSIHPCNAIIAKAQCLSAPATLT